MLSRFEGFDGVSTTGRAAIGGYLNDLSIQHKLAREDSEHGSFFVPPSAVGCQIILVQSLAAPFCLYQLLFRALAGLLSLLFVQQEVNVFVLWALYVILDCLKTWSSH